MLRERYCITGQVTQLGSSLRKLRDVGNGQDEARIPQGGLVDAVRARMPRLTPPLSGRLPLAACPAAPGGASGGTEGHGAPTRARRPHRPAPG